MKRAVCVGLTLVFCAFGFLGVAQASSIGLPTEPDVIGEPPADLLDKGGRELGPGEAASLAAKGQDLSLLEPSPSKLWQNKSYPVRDADPGLKLNDGRTLSYPLDGDIVDFVDHDRPDRYTYFGR